MAQRIDVFARVLGGESIQRVQQSTRAMVAQGDTAYRYHLVKRLLDIAISTLLLILLSPVLILAAVAIRLDSPGPILLTQKRIGKSGRAFGFFKFRSMYHNAECGDNHDFAREYINGNHSGIRAADRSGMLYKAASRKQVTRVGRFLRKSSIDELPQLINIMKGDMSLVGPRPSIHYEMEEYKPWHMRRLEVLPGLTGWAQIHGRSTLRFDDIVTLDLEYIRTRSWRMDLMILLRTIPVVLSGKGAG